MMVVTRGVGQPTGVRGGGRRGPEGYLFELTGGHPALDFVNTLDLRPTAQPKELLGHYADLADWGEQVGLVSASERLALGRQATRQPGEAQRALRRARTIREAMFLLFSSAAERKPLPAGPLAVLNQAVRTASAHLVLAHAARTAEWRWSASDSLDRVWWPVARAAADLLTTPALDRVRVCGAETCDWLFLDTSRNQSRRWCDMAVCGNRAKVRRFRRAQR